MRLALKERKRALTTAQGTTRDDVLDSLERLRRAAEGPAYVEPDQRQTDLFGGSR